MQAHLDSNFLLNGVVEIIIVTFYLSFYHPSLPSFPWRMVWQLKVPPRVAFFSWSVSLGKILTTDNFHKRRIIVLD